MKFLPIQTIYTYSVEWVEVKMGRFWSKKKIKIEKKNFIVVGYRYSWKIQYEKKNCHKFSLNFQNFWTISIWLFIKNWKMHFLRKMWSFLTKFWVPISIFRRSLSNEPLFITFQNFPEVNYMEIRKKQKRIVEGKYHQTSYEYRL